MRPVTDVWFPSSETITRPVSDRNNKSSDGGQIERAEWRKSLQRRIIQGIDACEGRGMTRDGIGAAMGYQSADTLSKWYNGHASPDAANLGKLGHATGLSLDWLVLERGPMFAPTGMDALRLQVIEAIASGAVPDRVVEDLVDPTPGV